MILDEPTTYLDIESPKVLERLLRENSGGFMLVNRDRRLISKFTDEICDIDAGRLSRLSQLNGLGNDPTTTVSG